MAYDMPENGRLHRPVKERSRKQVEEVFSTMEIKRDIRNQFNYDRVQDIYSSFYAGLDPRRRTEMADGGMVKEDPRAMANLSPEFIHREYPRSGFYSSPYIDDSVKE
jgi:hypothetical protein